MPVQKRSGNLLNAPRILTEGDQVSIWSLLYICIFSHCFHLMSYCYQCLWTEIAISWGDRTILIKTYKLCFIWIHIEINVPDCLVQAMQQKSGLSKKSVPPLDKQTIIFVFSYSIIIEVTGCLGSTRTRSICRIFPLCMELNAWRNLQTYCIKMFCTYSFDVSTIRQTLRSSGSISQKIVIFPEKKL